MLLVVSMKQHNLPNQVLRGSHWQQLQQAGWGWGSPLQELSVVPPLECHSHDLCTSIACVACVSGLQTGDVAVGARGSRLLSYTALVRGSPPGHKGPTALHRPAAKILAARRKLELITGAAEPLSPSLSLRRSAGSAKEERLRPRRSPPDQSPGPGTGSCRPERPKSSVFGRLLSDRRRLPASA